jgi:hypothetical protein
MASVIATDSTRCFSINSNYLPGDAGVAANITTINFPVAQLFQLCILGCTMPTVTFVAWLKFGP